MSCKLTLDNRPHDHLLTLRDNAGTGKIVKRFGLHTLITLCVSIVLDFGGKLMSPQGQKYVTAGLAGSCEGKPLFLTTVAFV